MGINPDGLAALITTTGNPDCHVILRGGSRRPQLRRRLASRPRSTGSATGGLPARVIVDASHGNSGKDHVRQAGVVHELAERIGAGETGIAGRDDGELPGGRAARTWARR